MCHITSQPWKFAIPFEAHQFLRSLNASASELACTLSSWATFGGMAEVFSMLEISTVGIVAPVRSKSLLLLPKFGSPLYHQRLRRPGTAFLSLVSLLGSSSTNAIDARPLQLVIHTHHCKGKNRGFNIESVTQSFILSSCRRFLNLHYLLYRFSHRVLQGILPLLPPKDHNALSLVDVSPPMAGPVDTSAGTKIVGLFPFHR